MFRFGDRLAKLVDAGVPVREAAPGLGVSRQRAYAILRATGRPMGSANWMSVAVIAIRWRRCSPRRTPVDAAAKAVGVAHSSARRMLVEVGLVDAARQVRGKATERARFRELLDAGWSRRRHGRSGSMCARPGTGVTGFAPGRQHAGASMARSAITAPAHGTNNQ